MSQWRIRLQRALVHGIAFLLVVFWSVPLGLALALANLGSLARIPGLGGLLDWLLGLHSWVKSFLEGLLPALVLLLAYSIIVPVLRALSAREYFLSRSKVVVATQKKFFALLSINIFFASTLGGSVVAIIDQIIKYSSYAPPPHGTPLTLLSDPFLLLPLLAVKLPAQVNFFMNYVLANSLITYTWLMWRPFGLLRVWLCLRSGLIESYLLPITQFIRCLNLCRASNIRTSP